MNSYLIDFFDNLTFDEINAFILSINGEINKTFINYPKTFLVNTDQNVTTNQLIERIILNDSLNYSLQSVVNLQPITPTRNLEVTINDENWSKIFSMQNVDVSVSSVNLPIWGNNTCVYLVDSGIKSDLTEFTDKNIVQFYSLNNLFEDRIGHGTAMASVIIGEECGLTSTTIKNVKVFDNDTPTRPSDLLAAFDAILSDFLSLNPKIFHVVNFSWTIPKNLYIENKIQKLYDNGLALVSAVGSLGQDANSFSPCSMSSVLSIASYDQNLDPCDFTTPEDLANNVSKKLNFNKIDSWAPGTNVKVVGLNGEYYQLSGSSISAAIYSASLVYNQSQSLFNNKPMRGNYTDGKYFYDYWLRLERKNILDLFNTDYSTVSNTICTFRNERSKFDPRLAPRSRIEIPWIVGMKVPFMFYNPINTASYEILTTLPEGCSIEREYFWFEPVSNISENIEIPIIIRLIDDLQIIEQTIILVPSSTPDGPMVSPAFSSGYPPWDCDPNCGWWCFQEAGCQVFGKTCLCL